MRGVLGVLGVLAVLAIVSGALAAPVSRAQVTASPMDLATWYELGQFDMVESAIRQAATGHLDVVLQAFRDDAEAWIEADGDDSAPRRRLVVATVALEAAYAGLDNQWVHSKELLTWACRMLRAYPSQPAEREWHLAALAVVEGARDWDLLGDHIGHVRRRFPDEPRLLLAEAFGRERLVADEISRNPVTHKLGRTDIYEEALAHPATAREARLRHGYLLLQGHAYEEAIGLLRQDGEPDDPGQRYLARLFEGWAHERREPPDHVAAERAFREALDAVPGAYTASLALALSVYRQGSGADISRILAAVANADPPVADPWLAYGYGDHRRWPYLIDDLRSHLR